MATASRRFRDETEMEARASASSRRATTMPRWLFESLRRRRTYATALARSLRRPIRAVNRPAVWTSRIR